VAQTLGVDFLPALDKLQSRLKAIANQVKDKSDRKAFLLLKS
jgi:hypothetical protein